MPKINWNQIDDDAEFETFERIQKPVTEEGSWGSDSKDRRPSRKVQAKLKAKLRGIEE